MSGDETDTPRDFEPFELQLYRFSPFGFRLTTFLIFVIAFGSALLIAWLTQSPPPFAVNDEGMIHLTDVLWITFVLSLILTTGFALNESGKRLWEGVGEDVLRAVTLDGEATVRGFAGRVPASWRGRYRLFILLGFLIGGGLNIGIMLGEGIGFDRYVSSIGLWFLIFSGPLYAMGLRAGLDVARESSAIRRLIRQHVEVDLFHLERLTVFGTVGLRAAISWLLMAGILLLFLVDARQAWIGLLAVFLAMCGGFWIFTSAVRPVHDKIRAAKGAELVRIHERMATLREAALAGDTDAAGALAGLTDYEIWIEQRPEWPLSPSVTLRFALYVLIPVVPIAGAYLFEKLADQILLGV